MGKTFKEQSWGQNAGHRTYQKSGKRQKTLEKKIHKNSEFSNNFGFEGDYESDNNYKNKDRN